MITQRDWSGAAGETAARSFPAIQGTAWQWTSGDVDKALAAALARLAEASRLYQQSKGIFSGPYYGTDHNPEEIIASASTPRAMVTRNHYGSLILNASRALFIDVDVAPAGRTSRLIRSLPGRHSGRWQRMLDDLRTVLSSEREEGFRIYRTAAGFRILATAREFEPGSLQSQRLMDAVGADSAFMHFCRIQKSFRARLTPKPWRCNTTKPPNAYPRESAVDQGRFVEWLAQYEQACRGRATCQYLGQVGSVEIHERVAPVVEVHDRETKAFEELPLA